MANSIPIVIADFETSLASAISAGATSLTLASATDDDGNALAAGKYCFTVNNGSSNKQYLLGQLNGTTVTSVVSVDRRGNETSGAANAARAGSPVIISDFATIQRVADILRGQEELDGDGPLAYDAEPSLVDRKELATVGYVLDIVNGGTVNFDNQIISSSDAKAGESISAGDYVFFQTSDQEWYQADADTAAEVENVQLGIALGAGTDGASITGGIQIAGVYTTSGLTAGDTYYASNTPGAISNSAGTTRAVVGVALSTTKLLLAPNNLNIPTGSEKQFLGATTGMISMYAGSSAPTGFLLCDGSAVSRTTYADLFAVCSTTYGTGDGSTTFNVPDLRARFPLGYSGGAAPTKTFSFVDGDVNTGTDVITIDENYDLYTGQPVALTTSGTLPTGLSATTYYVIRVSSTTIKLAGSVQQANDGIQVDITAASGGGTHTLTWNMTQRDMGDNGGTETQRTVPKHAHYQGQGDEGSSGGGVYLNTSNGSVATQPTGEDDPNNMPPYVTVNYIIKT